MSIAIIPTLELGVYFLVSESQKLIANKQFFIEYNHWVDTWLDKAKGMFNFAECDRRRFDSAI